MSDASKKLVLARRARFVAAAMAGAAVACGKEKAEPPQPCLSVVYQPPDASIEAAAPDAPDAAPMPCLSVARPKDAGKP